MPIITMTEWLEIDDIPLATPAWVVNDLSPLLDSPELRGSDVKLPGVAGVIPLRRRVDVTTKTLQMTIYGDKDLDGDPYEDEHDGVEQNILYLRTNLCLPPDNDDGTRVAVLHLVGGSTLEADVHVGPLKNAPIGPGAVRATLDISIPGGYFMETGS